MKSVLETDVDCIFFKPGSVKEKEIWLYQSVLMEFKENDRPSRFILVRDLSKFSITFDLKKFSSVTLLGGKKLSDLNADEKENLSRMKKDLKQEIPHINHTQFLKGEIYLINMENELIIKTISSETKPNLVIVDDSPVVLKGIEHILNKNQKYNVIATLDPLLVRDVMQAKCIDLIISDINMPGLTGFDLLKRNKMKHPFLLISGDVKADSQDILTSLEIGNVDFLEKANLYHSLFLEKVKSLLSSKLAPQPVELKPKSQTKKIFAKYDYAFIGISTGGVQTLELLFREISELRSPVIVLIHMPGKFTENFCHRLANKYHQLEFEHLDLKTEISQNKIYIANGDYHFKFQQISHGLAFKTFPKQHLSGFCPNIDFSFSSLAKIQKFKIATCLMTGMGKDGVIGLQQAKESGHLAFIQDEVSSIVYGMPKAAKEIKAYHHILNINQFIQLLTKE